MAARTPLVFLNSDAPSHAHAGADAMAPLRRLRTPNFVFTLAREERLLGRFALDPSRTIRQCRRGWWRSTLWRARRDHLGDSRLSPATLALTHYRVLLFEPIAGATTQAIEDSPQQVTELPLETLAAVRAIPGVLPRGEGILELTTWRGERVVVAHVPEARAVAHLIRSVAEAYTREELRAAERAGRPSRAPARQA